MAFNVATKEMMHDIRMDKNNGMTTCMALGGSFFISIP